jgi:hypothetical protein
LKDIFAFFPAGKFLNIPVIVTILAMLNLTFLLVFIGLNKQLQEEFHRPYHAMTRQLGNVGVFKSSRRKLLYIIRESFKSVLILTFSASVYLEYRLSGDDLYKGIYSYLFQSWWDSHVTRKLAILLFILIFLMIIMTLYSLFWRIFGQHYSES